MLKKLPKGIDEAIQKCPFIIGIGPSAWPRVISGYYFPKFKIICFNDCQDNEFIRRAGIEVFSQKEEDPKLELTPLTPGNIISTDLAKDYLSKLGEPFTFLIYKSVGKLEKVCKDNGWSFIGNKIELRDKFENKKNFKEILKQIGLPAIPGENIPISELTGEKLEYYQKTLGQKELVLQIAEATWGGGSGTLYVNDKSDIVRFQKRVEEIRKALESRKKKIETVNIAPFIDGISCSIPCCVTKFGTLTGSIQTQIVDIDEVGAKLATRSGVFAGHDWGFRKFDKTVQDQATHLGRKFGESMYKDGYRGIFGLDIIIDNKGIVWPVECNPRETDAFPLICMLQMEAGAIPMQVFHNLEGLGVDYEIDFEEVDSTYKKDYSASQILLYNKSDETIVDRSVLNAGVYKLNGDNFEFVRPGFAIWDLQNQDEFLLTEDISKTPGVVYDPHERMLRVIKKGSILKDTFKLTPEASRAVELIYKKLRLVPVEIGLKDRKGLKILFARKIINAKKSSDLDKADIINILRNTGTGFYRPISISWRKKVAEPLSKKIVKQVKSDMKKIKDLGIEIKVFDEISDEHFSQWLEFYKTIISSKEKGEIMIGDDWLEKKRMKGKKVGAILAFRGEYIIGGDIFFEVGGRLGVGYGVAERISGLAGGLTLLLDHNFLEYAKSKGYEEVTFGQDTNLYGYDLSKGLISYKLKLGFYPVPASRTYWVSTYFQDVSKFVDGASFFVGDGETLTLIEVNNNDTKIKKDKDD